MRSLTLMPALLALSRAAAIPNPTQPAHLAVSDEDLDAAIKEPLVNFVNGPVYGLPWYPDDPSPPSANPFKPYREDARVDDGVKGTSALSNGAMVWASLELQALAAAAAAARGPNDIDDDAVIPSEEDVRLITDMVLDDGYAFPDDEVLGRRSVETRSRDLEEIAKGPAGAAANATLPADYHRGLTKDQLCSAFGGLTWKASELMTPVYQWQPEYVPWLVDNKGPYVYVLDGLRHMEWILWKINRGLQYTTLFTPEEEQAIVRCWYQFSGIEWQRIRPVNYTNEPSPSRKPVQLSQPSVNKEPLPGPFHPKPWSTPRPSLKKLLRVITVKAPVSRYQSYATRRIHKVLVSLEISLMETMQDPRMRDYIVYDTQKGQGIEQALRLAKEAYDWKLVAPL
ncbi:uncharacterized protein GLRG_06978 [Colletotrichum graminicola M1.001]|uniref:Uncharacterized protein n=1 Tax=Colletotrichum graminicola (strain M1.001 / M2 / FGSC 10212) TaxID=645133 RepID=E3QLU6_COLGM|nr:uncharacterized protein GLRG_06978 [Colletotrichum graminicola M1.001]EFQ31834.1 hypothetical protein GLRG_06978 [Colletotrichum graminicola M1.001]